MRKLGQTISALNRYRRHWSTLLQTTGAKGGASAPSAAAGHLTELTGFGSNPGALRMFTYAPKNLKAAPALVVVLHGCTQSAGSYDIGAGWSTLADRYGFVLLLPEQTQANNPKTCFNWFLPGDTARDRGEALSIRQMIEKTIGAHGIDRGRVFITGLSAGGAMTAAMLATYPEVFAAGAIIAGLPYGTAGNVQQAFESMFQGRSHTAPVWGDLVRRASSHRGPWPRVSIWHGDQDATVKPMNADSLIRQWTDVHGIDAAPVEDVVDGYPRKVWWRDGADVIESYHHHRHGAWHAARDRSAWRHGRAVPARGGNLVVVPHREVLRPGRRGARAARNVRAATSRAKRRWCRTRSRSSPTSGLRFSMRKPMQPKFGAKPDGGHRRDGDHHQGADPGRADEAAGVSRWRSGFDPERLDAGELAALQPFEERAAGGRHVGELVRHACAWFSAATVSPPPATETSLPALVRSAA